MNFRNQQHNNSGGIDCEVDHPVYGWTPFSAQPDDPEQLGQDLYAEILAAGGIAAAPSPPAPTERELKLAGVEFEGTMCSATKEDMWGLKSIEDYVAAGQDTPFQFDNGNTLVLTQANMASFQAVWIPFRASFF